MSPPPPSLAHLSRTRPKGACSATTALTTRRHLFVLTETSLPGLLWYVFLGRDVYLVDILPGVRSLRGPLAKVAERLIQSGRLKRVYEVDPDLPWLENSPGRGYYHDIHHRVEPWLLAAFSWRDEDRLPPDYAIAMRKAASDTVGLFATVFLLAEWLGRNTLPDTWVLHGAPAFLARLEEAYHGAPGSYDRRSGWEPARLLNLANAVLNAGAAVGWLAARCRPGTRRRPESLWLMADRVDHLDIDLYPNVVEQGRPFAILERSPALRRKAIPGVERYRRLVREDARIPLALTIKLCARAVTEMAALWWSRAAQPPAVFGAMCVLIAKRAMFDAFFWTFRPSYFWARDDYSLDHTVRSLALRAVGATTIGVCHGIPINTYVHMWRDIDFDIYYLFGLHLYNRYYKSVWPEHMRIKAVGNYKMPSAHRQRITSAIGNRPRDIAFFATASPRLKEFLDYMMDVARHFSDRRVYIRMKPGRNERDRAALVEAAGLMPANMIVTEENTYELMCSRISYAVTSGSTVTVEALCYRLVSFVFEEPLFDYPYYADFPQLMLRDGKHMIARIEAIESGAEHYDLEAFRPLVDCDANFISIIREDLGLTAADGGTMAARPA